MQYRRTSTVVAMVLLLILTVVLATLVSVIRVRYGELHTGREVCGKSIENVVGNVPPSLAISTTTSISVKKSNSIRIEVGIGESPQQGKDTGNNVEDIHSKSSEESKVVTSGREKSSENRESVVEVVPRINFTVWFKTRFLKPNGKPLARELIRVVVADVVENVVILDTGLVKTDKDGYLIYNLTADLWELAKPREVVINVTIMWVRGGSTYLLNYTTSRGNYLFQALKVLNTTLVPTHLHVLDIQVRDLGGEPLSNALVKVLDYRNNTIVVEITNKTGCIRPFVYSDLVVGKLVKAHIEVIPANYTIIIEYLGIRIAVYRLVPSPEAIPRVDTPHELTLTPVIAPKVSDIVNS